MSNILDYLEWRGDITFDYSEFNEIDNIILSWLVYVDFEGIVPGDSKSGVTIKEASRLYFSKNNLEDILSKSYFFKSSYLLLKKIADSKRYADIVMCNYRSRIDYTDEVQFGAITYVIDKKLKYISFMGTDDTIIGWKEDFMLGFMESVQAQIEAVNYVNEITKFDFHKLYIGGHSKGGNLAVYASAKCKDYIQNKIIKIYNNDGPGFKKKFIMADDYQNIVDRVITIVPQSSIVGMLLEHEEKFEIVRSDAKGIMQHEPMSWQISCCKFIREENTDGFSKFVDSTIKNWYDKLRNEDRKVFINTVFDVIDSTGAKTLSDFSEDTLKKMSSAIKSLANIDKETRKMMTRAILLIFYSGKEAVSIPNPIKRISTKL